VTFKLCFSLGRSPSLTDPPLLPRAAASVSRVCACRAVFRRDSSGGGLQLLAQFDDIDKGAGVSIVIAEVVGVLKPTL
jgi:hypothetical protein